MSSTGRSELLYGPSFSQLRHTAFERANTLADDGIRRILYVEPNDRATTETATAWTDTYQSLKLEVTSLTDIVDDCYEQLFGTAQTLDRQQRLRLIEQALINADAEGVLDGAPALQAEFSQFFADVEAAGITSPAELTTALDETDLPARIQEPTVDIYRRYTALRDSHTSPETKPRSERFHAVATADQPLASCYPSVDVIVFADQRSLPSVEAALIERLTTEFTTIATLPAIHEAPTATGADRDLDAVFDTYRSLDYEFTYIPPEPETALPAIARGLYVLDDHTTPPTTDLTWQTAPTAEREVRHVARSIRSQLANGTPPEDIVVVVPELISYREQLADSFDAYEIPHVSYANKVIHQTHVGDAVLRLLDLCKPNPQTQDLVELLSNPLVDIDGVTPHEVAALNRRLPSQDCQRLLDELPDTAGTPALIQLLDNCDAARQQPATQVVETVTTLLDRLALNTNLPEATAIDAELEHRAYTQITAILDSVAEFANTTDIDAPLDRIERALSDVRITAPRQDATNRVEVLGLQDVRGKAYDHVYLVGATADALPQTTQQPQFFERLEAVQPALQTTPMAVVDTDDRLAARYQVATLLASAETAQITTPEATTDDERVLPAAIIDEIRRVTDLAPQPTQPTHGTAEDLQRTLAQYPSLAALNDAVDDCRSAGDLTQAQATRLTAGATCAAHRGQSELSTHDGRLTADTVDAVFPSESLTTFSPSRLKSYAKCGFAYYLNRGLNLDAPDDITPEPDALELGDFIHQTLYRFFTDLQNQPGEPVDLTTYELDLLEHRLLEAAQDAEATLDSAYDSPFFTTWKSRLLAGLASPAENTYYDSSTTGQPAPDASQQHPDRGFFRRFLTTEYEEERDIYPAWFETSVAGPDGDTFDLSLPDGTTVSLSGVIDRVDVDTPQAPSELSVLDYKTGSTNLNPTLGGLEFQLPLYALAAKRTVADQSDTPAPDITADAYFYDLDVPTGASLKGPLSERVGDGPTDDAYQAFLQDVTPRRINQLTTAIHNGAFHPSVLGPREAGCKYCDYSDVCDVRHHDRHDVIEHIDASDTAAYVADRGRGIDVTERLPGGDNA